MTSSKLVALALCLATACSSYRGSRTTTIVGAGTVAVGGGLFVASLDDTSYSEDLTYASLGTMSIGLLLVVAGIVGMVVLPDSDEAALALSRILITKAHEGECTTVREREHEVRDFDVGVYDRVLMTDPAVQKCLAR